MTFMNTARRFVLFCCLLVSPLAFGDYANVNGIRMYYSIQGQGTPVVLLHGGYVDSDMWAVESRLLAEHYEVIKIDSRGHGRSSDANVPITYELMASDTLALLDKLHVNNAHFVGWSDGAVIASQIAAFHPERVDQLVLIGAAYQSNVYTAAFEYFLNSKFLFDVGIDLLFSEKYKAVNPDPDHWSVFRDKLHALWQSPCYFANTPVDYCLEPLESIAAPTLVLAGENEIIQKAHTEAIASRIPGAKLVIVPGAGHFLPITKPFVTTNLILDFLNN